MVIPPGYLDGNGTKPLAENIPGHAIPNVKNVKDNPTVG